MKKFHSFFFRLIFIYKIISYPLIFLVIGHLTYEYYVNISMFKNIKCKISGTRKILFLSNTFEQMKIYKY